MKNMNSFEETLAETKAAISSQLKDWVLMLNDEYDPIASLGAFAVTKSGEIMVFHHGALEPYVVRMALGELNFVLHKCLVRFDKRCSPLRYQVTPLEADGSDSDGKFRRGVA